MNRQFNSVPRILVAWAALEAARTIARYIFPAGGRATVQYLLWLAFADLLMVAILGLIAMRSGWKGWRLGLAVAIVPFAVDLVNFIEGIVFLGGLDFRSIYQSAFVYALMIPILGTIYATDKGPVHASASPIASGSAVKSLFRFVACDIIYLLLYFIAGSIIFPFVREFYASHPLPSLGKIVLLQLSLRGPVFTAICLLLLRMAGSPRWTGIMMGTAFAILSGGVLLLPNPHLPDFVRWIHCAEIGSSGFLFGVFVARIWRASARKPGALTQTA
jgi:hypothetical protein